MRWRSQAAGRRPYLAANHEAAPECARHLIDLGGLGLTGIERKGDAIVIKAMTTHADVSGSAALQQAIPGLAALVSYIGDPHVRHRGTIGGSIANNDPAADYPAACLALGATITTNTRSIAADDFFTGMFDTALEDGEIITQVSFPIPKAMGVCQVPPTRPRAMRWSAWLSRKRGNGCARGGDRRGRQWRVPLERGGGEARCVRSEIAGRAETYRHQHQQRHSCRC